MSSSNRSSWRRNPNMRRRNNQQQQQTQQQQQQQQQSSSPQQQSQHNQGIHLPQMVLSQAQLVQQAQQQQQQQQSGVSHNRQHHQKQHFTGGSNKQQQQQAQHTLSHLPSPQLLAQQPLHHRQQQQPLMPPLQNVFITQPHPRNQPHHQRQPSPLHMHMQAQQQLGIPNDSWENHFSPYDLQMSFPKSLTQLNPNLQNIDDVLSAALNANRGVPESNLLSNHNRKNDEDSLSTSIDSITAGQTEEWQTQFFKTKLCPYHVEGRCINGSSCRFAHSSTEVRPLPDLHRTKLCESYVRKEPCPDSSCPFAHDPSELRTSSHSFYKVTLCNFYKKGRCWNGAHCRFAHGVSELQSSPDSLSSQPSEHNNQIHKNRVNSINEVVAAEEWEGMQSSYRRFSPCLTNGEFQEDLNQMLLQTPSSNQQQHHNRWDQEQTGYETGTTNSSKPFVNNFINNGNSNFFKNDNSICDSSNKRQTSNGSSNKNFNSLPVAEDDMAGLTSALLKFLNRSSNNQQFEEMEGNDFSLRAMAGDSMLDLLKGLANLSIQNATEDSTNEQNNLNIRNPPEFESTGIYPPSLDVACRSGSFENRALDPKSPLHQQFMAFAASAVPSPFTSPFETTTGGGGKWPPSLETLTNVRSESLGVLPSLSNLVLKSLFETDKSDASNFNLNLESLTVFDQRNDETANTTASCTPRQPPSLFLENSNNENNNPVKNQVTLALNELSTTTAMTSNDCSTSTKWYQNNSSQQQESSSNDETEAPNMIKSAINNNNNSNCFSPDLHFQRASISVAEATPTPDVHPKELLTPGVAQTNIRVKNVRNVEEKPFKASVPPTTVEFPMLGT